MDSIHTLRQSIHTAEEEKDFLHKDRQKMRHK